MSRKTASRNIAKALQRALELHQAGRLDEAQVCYRQVLAQDAQNVDALRYLGIIKAQGGQYEAALELIGAAVKGNPQSAEAHLNLGHIEAAAGRPEAALHSYERALSLLPDYPEALYGRGNALMRLERHEEAVASYDQALALVPGRPEVLTNRGNALHDLKRYDEALASYDQALALMQGVAMLHNNRGNTLRELKRCEDALASLDQALAIEPDYAEALINRGNVLQDLGRCEDALACFDKVLAMHPDLATAHNCRGNALHDLRRYEEAIASYGRAFFIKPDYAEARQNQGNVMMNMKRFEEAATSFARLLEITPDWRYAPGEMFHSQLHCCNWPQYAQTAGRIVQRVGEGKKADIPFSFLAISESAAEQLQCARSYVADKCPPAAAPLWTGQRYRHDKIRVAYMSADFREHAVSHLMVGLFEQHDRNRFETIAISFRPEDQSVTGRRVRAAFNRFIDVSCVIDRDVALLMRELEVDIAVDLMGFTVESRAGIFAHRPAPIQVNYLGFPGTMGADYMDYILADRHVVPTEHQAYYAEKIVYLPDTYQANDAGRGIAERTPTRAECGLPETGFVFCCFNNNYKITPNTFDVWMRLLHQTEGSVLWLLEDNAVAARNLRREAEHRGIAPQRLVFAPRMKLEEHLARHRLADLFLDTLPYNAHTTASDALWAGLPVLGCAGNAFAGRVTTSLLHAVGMPELITHSLEEYEMRALELAATPERLAGIRAKLARNRATHPLFDTDRFRRHLEAAYVTMWERSQRGDSPAGFDVDPVA